MVLLPIGIGAATTLGYGLSLAQAAPMIICLQLIPLIPSCYILTLAPLLGMRQWCQFRFLYGKYFNQVISFVGLLGTVIFGIVASVTGGQTVASVNPGTLSVEGGIAIFWGSIIGDYACYMPKKAPRFCLAFYFLSGFGVIFSLLMILGAALGGANLMIPTWATALERGGTGAIVGEILILISRLGGFGRFVLTILALTVVITSARDIYSISLAAQAVVPYLERVYRVILALITTGLLIGVAIPVSKSFISSLSALVSILSYTSGTTVLPFLLSGYGPCIATFVIGWGPIVCGMDTVWLRGPLAEIVGDLGWELAIITAIVFYIPLRTLEIKYRGRL
ncbi:Purine-cytosine permease FCY2 [Fusarium oxysporum f. sp. cubense race 1]|uniref:Purine-cytosine permease FCY2 n=1 Tax=Fusarium oxysporum f. sp. cubense (strain race 1) TaxID=1229664 RepID=N4U5V9_FUSC1|nr:Purine-cytosine permease FCY2 [Fusarium oxysporum f. sp. cubense race 1]